MFSLFSKKRHPAAKLYEHYSEDEKLTILAILYNVPFNSDHGLSLKNYYF